MRACKSCVRAIDRLVLAWKKDQSIESVRRPIRRLAKIVHAAAPGIAGVSMSLLIDADSKHGPQPVPRQVTGEICTVAGVPVGRRVWLIECVAC